VTNDRADRRVRARRWLAVLLWLAIVADALYAARFLLAMLLLNCAGNYDDTSVLQLNHWNWVESSLVLAMLPGQWPELSLLLLFSVALVWVRRGGQNPPQ
jgi:hypothetical protein